MAYPVYSVSSALGNYTCILLAGEVKFVLQLVCLGIRPDNKLYMNTNVFSAHAQLKSWEVKWSNPQNSNTLRLIWKHSQNGFQEQIKIKKSKNISILVVEYA